MKPDNSRSQIAQRTKKHKADDIPYYLAYSPWGSIRIQALPLGLYPGAAPWAYSRTKHSLRAIISKFVFTYKPTEIQAPCKSLPKKLGHSSIHYQYVSIQYLSVKESAFLRSYIRIQAQGLVPGYKPYSHISPGLVDEHIFQFFGLSHIYLSAYKPMGL